MRDLNSEQHDLVERLRWINDKVKRLNEDADSIKAQLRELGTGELFFNGGPVVTITPTKQFSAAKARQILPPSLLTLITVEAVDTKLAKKVLPPEVYAKCQAESGKATVKLVDP